MCVCVFFNLLPAAATAAAKAAVAEWGTHTYTHTTFMRRHETVL